MSLVLQELLVAERTVRGHILVFIDLDGLKWIDILGYLCGDDALKDTADLIRRYFRSSDVCAPMGGGEFAVLFFHTRPQNKEAILTHLRDDLARFNRKGDRSYLLKWSVGSVFCKPRVPLTIDELLRKADERMYEEKEGKRRDPYLVIRRGGRGR